MSQLLTTNDFPTVLDAMLYHNGELNRLVPLPASNAKNEKLQELKVFLDAVVERIQRENGLKGGEPNTHRLIMPAG